MNNTNLTDVFYSTLFINTYYVNTRSISNISCMGC